MKKLILFSVLATLCLNFRAEGASIKPLKIGDNIPAILLTGLVNYPSANISISNFRGKLLILDFWGTYCSSCIAKFPDAERFEKQYGDKLQILGVASESKIKISQFFKSPRGRQYKFPSVTADTVLSKLFPHRGIPHYVWINESGKVIAITGAEEFTVANVEMALKTGAVNGVQVKKDINANRPLFLTDDFPIDNSIIAYSIFTKGRCDGLPYGGRFRVKDGVTYGRTQTNATIVKLYETAAFFLFEKVGENYSAKRLSIQIADTAASKKIRTELYNYDFIEPLTKSGTLYADMLNDLNRVTGYQGKITKQKVPCYILKALPSAKAKIFSKGGNRQFTLFNKTPGEMVNCPMSFLVNNLTSEPYIDLPVIDETGLVEPIDLSFAQKPVNIESLSTLLETFGLTLIKSQREILMLEISDRMSHDD